LSCIPILSLKTKNSDLIPEGFDELKKIWLILSVFLLFALVGAADAASISFDTDCDVSVTFVGSNAGYNNIFGWVSAAPPGGTLNPLGTGHGTPVNSVYPIGSRAAKEDIYLYITTNEVSPRTYFSGMLSANPDGLEHVAVTRINANLVQVGFEDLYDGGDKDFDDLNLTVSCSPIFKIDDPVTPADPATAVPEFPTMAFPVASIIGMLGAVLFIQRTR
jgi:hypothetical protein